MTALAPCSVYASPRWLAVQTAGGRAPSRLLTAPDAAGAPRAWLPVHDRLPTRNPRYRLAWLCRGFPEAPEAASYVGLASGYQTEIATVAEPGDPGGAELLAALLGEALRDGPRQPLVVPYATDRLARALARIAPDALCVLEAADAWLINPHPPFEAWLAALPRETRRIVLQDQRRFAAAGFAEAVLPLAPHVGRFAELVSLHARRYGLDEPVAQLAPHLADIAAAFGDDAVLFAALHGGELVAAALGLVHGAHLYMRMVGNDHAVVGGTAAHFALAFYRPLGFCAQRGLAGVHLGLSIDRTKRALGAAIQPLWTIVLGDLPARVDASALLPARLDALTREDAGGAAQIREQLR
ncbi:MAG TPA: GNAT family N-acetyltransferase [Kofleriaceae bacterium]|nr:GNAT family N-acetyltransferase [Kofleriaceae bacterium]